jgi:hypothetical protein
MLETKNMNSELLLDISDHTEVYNWCEMLNCTEETLFICMYYSGNSIVSIQSFLSKNKEWLEKNNFSLLI